MSETLTECKVCGLDEPCHSQDRHLAHAEIERLKKLLDEAGNVLCGDEPKRPVMDLLEDIEAALFRERTALLAHDAAAGEGSGVVSDGIVCYAEHYGFGHYYCAFRLGALKRGHGDLCPWCRNAMGRVVEALGHSIKRMRVAELVREARLGSELMAMPASDYAFYNGIRRHKSALAELAALALAGGSEGG